MFGHTDQIVAILTNQKGFMLPKMVERTPLRKVSLYTRQPSVVDIENAIERAWAYADPQQLAGGSYVFKGGSKN